MVLRPTLKPMAPGIVLPRMQAATSSYSARTFARLQNLVAAAVRALSADGAALIRASNEGLATMIADGIDLPLSPELTQAALAEPVLLIERAEETDVVAGVLYAAELRFFASARVGSALAPSGFLAVYARDPRSLTRAQEYVLLTLAAEIDDQLELDDLRTSALQLRRSDDERDERLRLLESVVVNANDAVLITEAEPVDLPGPRIVFANDAFTRTTGYAIHEVIGKTPRILQGPDTSDAARKRIREALKAWEPIEVELLNYHKDGTPFWVELSIVPVPNEAGYFTHWVSVQRDVTERKLAEETATKAFISQASSAALEYRAFHDELTGLRNRAYLNDRVDTLLERVRKDCGEPFAVIFLDLDRFKIVNDSLGHRIGDLMLIELARRLEGCIRTQDTLVRLGGDEFTCIIEASNLDDVVAVAERILAALRPAIRLAGREIFASTSIGIAYVDEHYETAAEIFRDADTAMYRAKQSGGMRYELFHEAMHESALALLRLQMDLRGAIDRSEFVLYYQPLVNLDDGRAYGLEALVRWRHPENGIVAPAHFIPIAEETGLIVAIGSWVLHEACRRMALWHRSAPDLERLTISVNVSSRQLFDPHFFHELEHALEASGLDPTTLQLEITESIFLTHEEDFAALLERIRALGVRMALDDFGIGYSSLSYLERFRFDTLKIDQSFVAKFMTTAATSEIVRLVIGLASALGMDAVAEGVEKASQWEALRAFGCARGQGYLFSRAVPEDEVMKLLTRPLARPSPIPSREPSRAAENGRA